MCSPSVSSCLEAQCLRTLVVNWSSGWQGRLRTIFTISSLGLYRDRDRDREVLGWGWGQSQGAGQGEWAGLTSPCGAAAADRTRPQDALDDRGRSEKGQGEVSESQGAELEGVGLTFVLEVLQDGDNGLQRDAVGQEELPGAVLLKGLPVQGLD